MSAPRPTWNAIVPIMNDEYIGSIIMPLPQAKPMRVGRPIEIGRVYFLDIMNFPLSADDLRALRADVLEQELLDEGRRLARQVCRHGERGISREGFITIAQRFRDGTIGASEGFLQYGNAVRQRGSLAEAGSSLNG